MILSNKAESAVKRWIWYLCSLILSTCIVCSYDTISGGSEIGNPVVVSGIIHTLDSIPAEDVEVFLLTEDYNPIVDGEIPDTMKDTTDSKGVYAFHAVDSGTYNILGIDRIHGTQVLIMEVTVSQDTTTVHPHILRESGVVKVTLTFTTADDGYLYIPGTPIAVDIPVGADLVMIDSVPAGTLPSIYYGEKEDEAINILIEQDVLIMPSDTVTIPYELTVLFIVGGDTVDIDTLTSFPDSWHDTINYYSFIHRDYIKSAGTRVITRLSEELTVEDTTGVDVVFLSYSAELYGSMQPFFRDLQKPIIVSNPELYPLLAMTGNVEGQDYDTDVDDRIIMRDTLHPLAADFTLDVYVATSRIMGWGIPGVNADTIAVGTFSQYHVFIFNYDPGVEMIGKTAPHTRIGFFAQATHLTEEGIILLKNAVIWAANGKR